MNASLTESNGTIFIGKQILSCDCKENNANSHGKIDYRINGNNYSKKFLSVFSCGETESIIRKQFEKEKARLVCLMTQSI